jgi:uracil-DNA glycosylase
VEYVSEATQNPFGFSPPCDRAVCGYGDVDADFHVIGDHPGVHGGVDSGIPFAGQPWSDRFFETLYQAGLLRDADPTAETVADSRTFFSYLHMCDPGDGEPDADSYAQMEPFFDAELRAITAHVLLPVGPTATAHVLRNYTARVPSDPPAMEKRHAEELRGSGWLIIPVKSPDRWDDSDGDRLVARIGALDGPDYEQISDLGRFIPGSDPYLVR